MLCALLEGEGIQAVDWGIAADDETMLLQTVERALRDCDGLWISGGSSVGQKDALCRVLETVGEVLFHGVAMKPGKPALLARAGDKPLAGLPGTPGGGLFCSPALPAPSSGPPPGAGAGRMDRDGPAQGECGSQPRPGPVYLCAPGTGGRDGLGQASSE